MIVGGQGFRPRIAVVDGLATRALPRKLVLSGHSAQMHQGGGSSFTPWYVATELSWAAGLEKTEALAAVLPWCWEEIVGGNERWGSARSVDLVWQKIRAAVPSTLPRHAPEGLTELLAQWGVTGTAPIEVEVAPPPPRPPGGEPVGGARGLRRPAHRGRCRGRLVGGGAATGAGTESGRVKRPGSPCRLLFRPVG